MEEQKKKKEVEIKTQNPMWIVILIAVLIIGLGCETVYLLKERKIRNSSLDIQKNNNSQISNVVDNISEEHTNLSKETENKDAVEIIGLEGKYNPLEKTALQNEDIKKAHSIKVDFNGDGQEEELQIKEDEKDLYSINFKGKKILNAGLNRKIYIVDLDKNDKYLDFIVKETSDGGAYIEYIIFKYTGTTFSKIKYSTLKTMTNEKEHFYYNENNEFALIGDIETKLNKVVTNKYYIITDDKGVEKNADTKRAYDAEYTLEEDVNSATDAKKASLAYSENNKKVIKKGTKVQLLGWDKCDDIEILKVKINNEICYIYELYA